MAFFKRKVSKKLNAVVDKKKEETNQSKLVNVEDVYLATTTIVSSYNDGFGFGPRCVTCYLLVRLENNEYYELFAGKKIQKEEDTHEDGIGSHYFDVPYIEKVKPLKDYLRDKTKLEIDIQELFDFVIKKNVYSFLKELDNDQSSES